MRCPNPITGYKYQSVIDVESVGQCLASLSLSLSLSRASLFNFH